MGLPCGDESGLANGIKTMTFQFTAQLPGAALTIEPVSTSVDIDCRRSAGRRREGIRRHLPHESDAATGTAARDGRVENARERAMNEVHGESRGCSLGSAHPSGARILVDCCPAGAPAAGPQEMT